jgi:hypothetical protein
MEMRKVNTLEIAMLNFLEKKTSINGMLKEHPGILVSKTLLINIKKWTFAFYKK